MARQRRAAITAVAVAATAVAVLLPAALASMSVPVGRSTRFLKHWDTTKSLQVTLNEPKLCDPNVQQCTRTRRTIRMDRLRGSGGG